MKKPLVIYFQQNPLLGACEEYFYLLMQGLDKKIFDAAFICPKISTMQSLVAKVEALGIKVYQYCFDASNLKTIIYLRSLFRRLKPDIAHFNDPCLNGIIAARLGGVPVLVMTHHTPELNRRYNIKGKFLEIITLRHSKLKVIFTSEYDRQTGVKRDKIKQERSFVISYGLPSDKFSPRQEKKEVCNEFAIDEGSRLIANIARLSSQKGQHFLIEAAPLVIEKFKSAKFFFVGEGELESELKALVRKAGLENYFVFTGHRTDIPRLLSAFDMLVMPSLFEGLCFAVIEASAMCVPVVATAVGGMRYSVINGKTGLLIPPKDIKALADAILWMLENPAQAKQMGLAGRKHFTDNFTQQGMVRKTAELYGSLLKGFPGN